MPLRLRVMMLINSDTSSKEQDTRKNPRTERSLPSVHPSLYLVSCILYLVSSDLMKDYQREFLDFCLATGVLRFGEFTLKSGLVSPYFFNAGLFNTGRSLARLGWFYAQAIRHAGIEFDMLYGPAYKGIPLACSTAIALAEHFDRDVPYAFHRKEAKKHAEGGIIVGHPLQGRVLIIDDVISAGLSVGESVDIIRQAAALPAGGVPAVHRPEQGNGAAAA